MHDPCVLLNKTTRKIDVFNTEGSERADPGTSEHCEGN